MVVGSRNPGTALAKTKKTACAPKFTFVQGKFNLGTLARASTLTQANSAVYRFQHRSNESVNLSARWQKTHFSLCISR
jgi:hypothetical protein